MQPAILLLSPLKSLQEFYAQKRRLTEKAFDLAQRPGLEGDLSRRLYYLCLLTEKMERMLLPQLAAAGRCVDVELCEAAGAWLYAFRASQGITFIRPATPRPLRECPRYAASTERDWMELARINATTDKTTLVVMDEHTLGYIHALRPEFICHLASSVLRGAPLNLRNAGCYRSGHTVRLATEADFDTYRVMFGAYRDDPEYIYQK